MTVCKNHIIYLPRKPEGECGFCRTLGQYSSDIDLVYTFEDLSEPRLGDRVSRSISIYFEKNKLSAEPLFQITILIKRARSILYSPDVTMITPGCQRGV